MAIFWWGATYMLGESSRPLNSSECLPFNASRNPMTMHNYTLSDWGYLSHLVCTPIGQCQGHTGSDPGHHLSHNTPHHTAGHRSPWCSIVWCAVPICRKAPQNCLYKLYQLNWQGAQHTLCDIDTINQSSPYLVQDNSTSLHPLYVLGYATSLEANVTFTRIITFWNVAWNYNVAN